MQLDGGENFSMIESKNKRAKTNIDVTDNTNNFFEGNLCYFKINFTT